MAVLGWGMARMLRLCQNPCFNTLRTVHATPSAEQIPTSHLKGAIPMFRLSSISPAPAPTVTYLCCTCRDITQAK